MGNDEAAQAGILLGERQPAALMQDSTTRSAARMFSSSSVFTSGRGRNENGPSSGTAEAALGKVTALGGKAVT
jgi:hypothetical protein